MMEKYKEQIKKLHFWVFLKNAVLKRLYLLVENTLGGP